MTVPDRRTVLVSAISAASLAGLDPVLADARAQPRSVKPVRVNDLVIGEGRTKIIIPILEKTGEAAIAVATSLAGDPNADLVELRLDSLVNALNHVEVAGLTTEVAKALKTKPMLVTFRTKSEGGETAIADPAYRDLYMQILARGHADLIDIELFRVNTVTNPVLREAKRRGVPVVMSNHDFGGTPDTAELVSRLRRMQALGADIPKIAAMPHDAGDVLKLLTATFEMHSTYADRPLITMSMAGEGLVSRLAGEVFGSAASFGKVGNGSAPGQIEASRLAAVMDVVHQALA